MACRQDCCPVGMGPPMPACSAGAFPGQVPGRTQCPCQPPVPADGLGLQRQLPQGHGPGLKGQPPKRLGHGQHGQHCPEPLLALAVLQQAELPGHVQTSKEDLLLQIHDIPEGVGHGAIIAEGPGCPGVGIDIGPLGTIPDLPLRARRVASRTEGCHGQSESMAEPVGPMSLLARSVFVLNNWPSSENIACSEI